MVKIINTILKHNKNLFGSSPKVEKINVGFTNTIYNINDTFIVKICTNIDNENAFQNEINFYKTNKENNLIPKLYYASTDKKHIPFFYEIIEKVDGVSLYNVWHTFNEQQREAIVKELCTAMKDIHSNTGKYYDWAKKLKNQFMSLYEKAKDLGIFSKEEQNLLDYAYNKFEKYLESNDFVLIHNDLHFDNILFNDYKIKIIDFERSMYAPRDFELNIIYKMIRKPWKFASSETESYTNLNDYSNIMSYIKKYYPKLVNIPNLYKRLAIYDIVYFLKHLVQHPNIEELKNDVLTATKIVLLKDEKS